MYATKKYSLTKEGPFSNSITVLRKTKHHCLVSLVLTAWYVLLACSPVLGDTTSLNTPPQLAEEKTAHVFVEHSSDDNATIYSISSAGCTIKLIARNSEIGVIKHWSQCAASLEAQLPLLTQVCKEFFSKDKNAQAFRTLFWGRLAPDESRPPWQELSLRLALAAYKSPDWNTKRGKPINGDINGFVRNLANKEMIYPELKELFARFQRNISFSCAEKVLVLEAAKLPFYDQLKQHGIKASDRLPFDCMAWFSVIK